MKIRYGICTTRFYDKFEDQFPFEKVKLVRFGIIIRNPSSDNIFFKTYSDHPRWSSYFRDQRNTDFLHRHIFLPN